MITVEQAKRARREFTWAKQLAHREPNYTPRELLIVMRESVRVWREYYRNWQLTLERARQDEDWYLRAELAEQIREVKGAV